MITFPVVDAHLHLWDIKKLKYPWLDGGLLEKTFLLEDYNKECGTLKVEKMVFVQCECDQSQYLDEVAWVAEIAEKDERLSGIVAWAPLEKGEAVRPEIENLARNKLVKGIRRKIQFQDDVDFCIKPDFIKGVKILAEYGLSFDIAITYKLDKYVLKLVDQCPEVKFILNHIGKPNIKEGILEPWKAEIKQLSQYPNLYCKVSSLATEADWDNWTIEELRPYSDFVFEHFGFDRTVYATDWPVASLAGNIEVCAETLEALMRGCSGEELKKVFHDNALRFYNI